MADKGKQINLLKSQAEQYLNKHKIIELMEDLCSDLCFDQPQNIDEFVIQRLKLKHRQGFKTEYFDQEQVKNMFILYDLDHRGFITKERCKEALKNLSNNFYQTVQIDLIQLQEKVDQNTFISFWTKINSMDFSLPTPIIQKNESNNLKVQFKFMPNNKQYEQLLDKAKVFCQKNNFSFAQSIADSFFEQGFIIQAIEIYQNIISTDPSYKCDIQGLGCKETILSYYEWNVFDWYDKNRKKRKIKSSPYDSLSLCYFLINQKQDLTIYLKKAELWYKKMIEQYPKNYQFNFGLGNIFYLIESFDEAIKQYDKIIEINPELTFPYIGKAFIYDFKRKNNIKATEICQKVLLIDSQNFYAKFILARTIQNADLRIKTLKQLSQKIPYYPRVINQIGVVYGGVKKNYDEAINYYKKCLQIAPFYSSVYNNIGVNYELKKNYEEARKNYYKGMQMSPNYNSCYINIRDVYNAINFSNEDIQKQITKYPNLKLNYFYFKISDAFLKQQKSLKKSKYWAEKAVKQFPEQPQSWHQLAMIQDQLNQNFQAIKSYQKAIQLNPLDSNFYFNCAITYKKLFQYQNAISKYLKCIQINPKFSYAYNNLASIYKDRKDLESAIQIYQKGIYYNSQYTLALTSLGYCYLQLGKYKEAFNFFERAEKALPNDKNNLSQGNKMYLRIQLKKFSQEGDKWKKSGSISEEEKQNLQKLINQFEKKFSKLSQKLQKAQYPIEKTMNEKVIKVIRLLAQDKFQLNNFSQVFDLVQSLFHEDEDYFHIIPLAIINKFTSDAIEKKIPVMDIEQNLKKIVKKLGEKLSIKLKKKAAQEIKSIQVKLDLCKPTNQQVNLFKDTAYFQNYQELYVEIMKVNEDAKKSFFQFSQLVEAVRNSAKGIPGGLGTKMPAKVADQFKVILRIMEKMFKKDINEQRTAKMIQTIGQKLKNLEKINLNSVVRQIVGCWTDQISTILKERNKKRVETQCYVSDLLRAKCYFRTTDDLLIGLKIADSMCNSFGYEIIQLDDRLAKPQTKDVVLKILIKQAVCEFQLAIKQDQSLTHLDHSVYQIMRSPLGCIFGSYLNMSKSVKYPLLANCQDILEIITKKNEKYNKQVDENTKKCVQYVLDVLKVK